jgi:hypothetical protein
VPSRVRRLGQRLGAPCPEGRRRDKGPPYLPDDLQAKIAYGGLAQFLLKDHILYAPPRLKQPAVFDLAVELANGLVLRPVEVQAKPRWRGVAPIPLPRV